MPLFRSTALDTITFDAGDTRFVVPPGGVCELDKRVSYVPAARGLPLKAIDRADVKRGEPVIDGAAAPPPRQTRVRGVASGRTVLESDDGDDKAGAVISDARAALSELAEPVPSASADEGADLGASVPAVVAKAARARKDSEG